MSKYSVKEIYLTKQGEGYHTGKPARFIRFSGCNLWSGLEKDRILSQEDANLLKKFINKISSELKE